MKVYVLTGMFVDFNTNDGHELFEPEVFATGEEANQVAKEKFDEELEDSFDDACSSGIYTVEGKPFDKDYRIHGGEYGHQLFVEFKVRGLELDFKFDPLKNIN